MKIMAIWVILEDLEVADTRRNYKGWDSQSLVNLFKYQHPYGLHFRYRHQIDDHNNRRYSSILLESTWST